MLELPSISPLHPFIPSPLHLPGRGPPGARLSGMSVPALATLINALPVRFSAPAPLATAISIDQFDWESALRQLLKRYQERAKEQGPTIEPYLATCPGPNAPEPVARAAVLYVFRVMVDDDIPMNAGCLRPINIVIPKGSMLSPQYPAAVVAGNVSWADASWADASWADTSQEDGAHGDGSGAQPATSSTAISSLKTQAGVSK